MKRNRLVETILLMSKQAKIVGRLHMIGLQLKGALEMRFSLVLTRQCQKHDGEMVVRLRLGLVQTNRVAQRVGGLAVIADVEQRQPEMVLGGGVARIEAGGDAQARKSAGNVAFAKQLKRVMIMRVRVFCHERCGFIRDKDHAGDSASIDPPASGAYDPSRAKLRRKRMLNLDPKNLDPRIIQRA